MNISKLVRWFSGKRQSAYASPDAVAVEESQAALRQLSLERLMAYGVHHPDAVELRARVWSGERWQDVATDLAETCLAPPERHVAPETAVTRRNRLFRASALLRMSQMMMLSNSPERTAIFVRAGKAFEEAAALGGDRRRMTIDTKNGRLAGWLYPSVGPAIGRAVVIGGIEGWAMDFGEMGLELARRGVEALLLDGPGQGESRFIHEHYLRPGWEASYYSVFDLMERLEPRLPFGFIGNSMGGSVAMHLAAREPRIAACCDNGGPLDPGRARASSMMLKVAAHVGDVTPEFAIEVWKSIVAVDPAKPVTCPLLVVHGGQDPLVSTEDAEAIFGSGKGMDTSMVEYSDGDHCVYNHADDKHALICDWMASRLGAR